MKREEKKQKNSKGITLIALVITIIVLLILAGVSISMLTGENGLITKAEETKIENRAARVEEEKDLWRTNNDVLRNIDEEEKQEPIENLLTKLLEDNQITEVEKNEIMNKGYVKIGNRTINFSEGMATKIYVVKSSDDEITFNNVIKEGDILNKDPNYNNYTIEGISNEKDGTYTKTGKVLGKTGELEIMGDINDTNFKYNLTNFMQGDEIFYIKINIDNQPYYQEVKVIQGKEVIYEEDFIGIEYFGNWTEENDENVKNRKIKVAKRENQKNWLRFKYLGSGFDISVKIDNTAVIRIEKRINDILRVMAMYELDYHQDIGIQYVRLSKNRTLRVFNAIGNEEDIHIRNVGKGNFKIDSIIVYR